MRRLDLTGRIVVITGGAGGIGRAVGERLAARGAILVVVDLDGDRAEDVAAGLPGSGHLAVQCDLTMRAEVRALFDRVGERFGRLDVLVNNVGMTSAERFDERSLDSIERELDVNLLSPLVTTHLALPLLKASKDPRVITTVSLGGVFPLGETPIYTASKFGLRGAMLAIGLDLRQKGILVSSVLPSAVDTPMLQQEAVEGGNALQFQDPPQQPSAVADSVMSLLERPRLETCPRPSEGLLVRVAMLMPNLLPRMIALFRRRGDRGQARYLEELRRRGIARHVDGRWELVAR
jgi:NAD(P)-dependent dehydrogenase (short-subunit alcohol dehydrogenase family)